MIRSRTLPACLFLLVFTPVFAESIATTNTPWFGFLNPALLLFMVLLYGSAALLLRELWVRGRLGFGQFVLYALVFAGINEGLVAATWFKPEVGKLSATGLGRYGGVNWRLAVGLTIFHAVFSLLIPICLSFIVFPELATTRLLARRGLVIWSSALLLVSVGTMTRRKSGFPPYESERLILFALLLGLTVVTTLVPVRPRRTIDPAYRGRTLGLLGAGFYALFFLTFFVIPLGLPKASMISAMAMGVWSLYLGRRILARSQGRFEVVLPFTIGMMLPALLVSIRFIVIGQPVIVALFLCYLYRLSRQNPLPLPDAAGLADE